MVARCIIVKPANLIDSSENLTKASPAKGADRSSVDAIKFASYSGPTSLLADWDTFSVVVVTRFSFKKFVLASEFSWPEVAIGRDKSMYSPMTVAN